MEGFSAGFIDDDDVYKWEVVIMGPPDTLYEGGVFKAHLLFPKEYPLRPPRMRFVSEMWHPNGTSHACRPRAARCTLVHSWLT